MLVLLGIVVACSGNSERSDNGDPDAGADASSGRAGAGSGAMGARSGRGGSAGRGGSSGMPGAGGTAAMGGSGNVGAEAGEAGVPGVGGSVPLAGSGGAGPVAGTAGSAGFQNGGTGGFAPTGWQCSVMLYGDGSCDCGCGIQDSDCERSDDLDECETCNRFGSCNNYQCPGRIDPENTTACEAPPSGWTCLDYYYADTVYCDCGCGVMDPDCENDDIGSCDTCGLSGGCSGGTCPGSIDPNDITTCALPEGWTCEASVYNDGFYCDCGCGVIDSDCGGLDRNECGRCTADGSCAQTEGYCSEHIDANNNAICSGPPSRWSCSPRFFGDGVLCHCGCGVIDPDCADRECEVCNATGACSSRACPGMIDPNHEEQCIQPEVPDGWTCDYAAYGDGFTCHCGCGVQDYDCLTTELGACEDCYRCGSSECPANVDATDPTKCVPPPADWRCPTQSYRDGYTCDCGCGVPDPDCEGTTPGHCWNCPEGSCAEYTCLNLEPADNAHCVNEPPPAWTCEFEFYGDGACDCGCGVVDLDCASPARSSCIFCDPEGGCSNMDCRANLIDPENNAVCGG
jgi:hypothetical protein